MEAWLRGGHRFAGHHGGLDNPSLLMEASLMRNDPLNTARGAHKRAQKTPKATQKPRLELQRFGGHSQAMLPSPALL